ncbi:NAD(P)-dependent oxidoreductase [Ramlibacter sp. G-1-2-2]|uniref:NAD(P)-dependent oxidoreductase n=2 Tax=Ramlibacter agri TaxID=2728837 RepID=A0A848GXK8_9BURK|nr:NAD(P)-dependent oxidoreductase [Ramlibacter agri]
MRVHVIGVGKMGLPMALHFRRGGHVVSVQDTAPERLALARAAGLAVDAQALRGAEVVLSSLPHDDALLAVGGQVAREASRGTIYMDTSTVSPRVSAAVARACSEAGIAHVRATVSGNNHMAEAAQLTVMASGPREAYDAVQPLLQLLGPAQFWLGDAEQARLMKLVVNLMIAQTSAMLAEALALGRKGGLQWEDMWSVLTASAVASPILKAKSVQLAKRDFTPTFTVEQMIKDLGLILGAGSANHVPLPQTAATLQLMQAAVAQGRGGEDYAAIIRTVETAAGLSPD